MAGALVDKDKAYDEDSEDSVEDTSAWDDYDNGVGSGNMHMQQAPGRTSFLRQYQRLYRVKIVLLLCFLFGSGDMPMLLACPLPW
jgi:hypothetical protein